MRILHALAFAFIVAAPSFAQDLTAAKASDPVPTELAAPIRDLLAEGSVTANTGPATVRFWWVKSLPVKDGSGAVDWKQVEEGTIVGAARVEGPQTDIRGRRIKTGVYVLRYGIQPATGDHLGASPFRDFLLLVPAVLDTSAATMAHDKLMELSPRPISISEAHPAAWSLDPPVATDDLLKVRTNDAGHKAVVFEVPTSRAGQNLRFGLTLVGKIS